MTNGQYLFLQGDNLSEKQLRTKTENYYKRYYESLRKAGLECGIKMATHDWRRSFAQSIIDNGASIYEAQRSLRHKDTSTTIRYFKDDPEKTAATMLKHQEGIKTSIN